MISALTPLAKTLRKNQTEAEKLVWRQLRSKGLSGLKFRRQQPIGDYIVDFVCLEKKLIIEVDGGQHAENENDRKRDAWLQSEGFAVLRFWNNDVLGNLEGVMERIYQSCGSPSSQAPPLKGGEEKEKTPPSRRRSSQTSRSLLRGSSFPSTLRGEGQGGGER
jgi:very-short-patch-repair endonuclease